MKAYINSIYSVATESGATEFKMIEPNYAEVLGGGGELRRMSRLVKLGMLTSQQCVQETNTQQVDAILVGTGLGGGECTEKFLESILQNETSTHSPTPFIQSLPNAIAGQIALKLKCYGYNMTYVHRGFSFETAIIDALMLMEENTNNKDILVGGIDEITENYCEQMRQAGYVKNQLKDTNVGITLGEGATFMQISSSQTLHTKAVLKELKLLYRPEDGLQIMQEVLQILENNNLIINDIDFVLLGNCGDVMLDKKLKSVEESLFKNHSKMYFKESCGEYHTASGFAVWQAVQVLTQTQPMFDEVKKDVQNVIILNHYNDINYSIFLLSKS